MADCDIDFVIIYFFLFIISLSTRRPLLPQWLYLFFHKDGRQEPQEVLLHTDKLYISYCNSIAIAYLQLL